MPLVSGTSLAIISYAHGPYDDQTIALADRLNREGVDCDLDVYEEAPPEGWPRWMERMMTQRTVLVIASEPYYRRHHRKERRGKGRGTTFETGVLAQRVVDMQGKNEGIIPILFDPTDQRYIPEFLRDVTWYNLSQPGGYDDLYRRLTARPKYEKPPLGKIRVLPPVAIEPTATLDDRFVAEIDEGVDEAVRSLMIFSHVCHMIMGVHPIEYRRDRFSEEEERNVIRTATLNSGYAFPVNGPESSANLDDGFHVFAHQITNVTFPEYREYYRFRRNGLFVLARVSPDDIDEHRQYRAIDPVIGFGTLVSTLTKMMGFAAALAKEFRVDTRAFIIVSGLGNHRLLDDLADHALTLGDIKVAHQSTVQAEFTGSPATFKRERVEWTSEVVSRCLRALNFPETTKIAKNTAKRLIQRVK
jgi:hypothetical protein